MADISTELANIMSAIYGEEVRGSIHDAIEKMNTQLNSAISGTLNGLGFRGDYSSGTLDQLTTENDRGIWRLLPSGDYTDYPEDYQKGRGGLLFVYVNGSYCRQELRYYKLTEGTGADSSKVWTRTLSGGEGIFSDFTDWIVEAPLSFKGDYRNGASLNALTNDADKGIYRLLASNSYSGMPSDFVQTVSGCLKVYVFGTNVIQELSYISNFNAYECISWKRVYTGSWGEWEKNTDTTLTKSGAAADAKAVGDAIGESVKPYGEEIDWTQYSNLVALPNNRIYQFFGRQGILLPDEEELNNCACTFLKFSPFLQSSNTSNLTFCILYAWAPNNEKRIYVDLTGPNASYIAWKRIIQSIDVDTTLTAAGKAADAKAVGDAIDNLSIPDLDTTLTIEGSAADAKAVGDNTVSSKGFAMSMDGTAKDLNDYTNPGIYYVGNAPVTNWAFDSNYKGVLVVFNPMKNGVTVTDGGIVQLAFSNGDFSYRIHGDLAWGNWTESDNSKVLNVINSIVDTESVQSEIEATENQNYYLIPSGTSCIVRAATGSELVLYSVPVEAKKNYHVTATNVASIDNAILAFSTRALADNVTCTMLIDNTGGQTIDYSYSPTQDGYLFLSKGTNANMSYKIYEVSDKATLKTDKTLSIESMPADAKAVGDNIAPRYSSSDTYQIGQYVLYNGQIYECTSDIPLPEIWDPEHWQEVTIGKEADILKRTIYNQHRNISITIGRYSATKKIKTPNSDNKNCFTSLIPCNTEIIRIKYIPGYPYIIHTYNEKMELVNSDVNWRWEEASIKNIGGFLAIVYSKNPWGDFTQDDVNHLLNALKENTFTELCNDLQFNATQSMRFFISNAFPDRIQTSLVKCEVDNITIPYIPGYPYVYSLYDSEINIIENVDSHTWCFPQTVNNIGGYIRIVFYKSNGESPSNSDIEILRSLFKFSSRIDDNERILKGHIDYTICHRATIPEKWCSTAATSKSRCFTSMIYCSNTNVTIPYIYGYPFIIYVFDENRNYVKTENEDFISADYVINNKYGYISIIFKRSDDGDFTNEMVSYIANNFDMYKDTEEVRNIIDELSISTEKTIEFYISESLPDRIQTSPIFCSSDETTIPYIPGYPYVYIIMDPDKNIIRNVDTHNWCFPSVIRNKGGYVKISFYKIGLTVTTADIDIISSNFEIINRIDKIEDILKGHIDYTICHRATIPEKWCSTAATSKSRCFTSMIYCSSYSVVVPYIEGYPFICYIYDENMEYVSTLTNNFITKSVTVNNKNGYIAIIFMKNNGSDFDNTDLQHLSNSFGVGAATSGQSISSLIRTDYTMPILTILDDDGRNGFIEEAAMLKERNATGTFAVIKSLVGTGDYMSLSQIMELKHNGHDCISHTATHSAAIYGNNYSGGRYCNFSLVSDETVYNDLKESRDFLLKYGLNADALAWPWGGYPTGYDVHKNNPDPEDEFVCGADNQQLRYAKIARNVGFKYAVNSSGGLVVGSQFDDMWIPRVEMMADDTEYPLSYYTSLIDTCAEQNGWMIVMTHANDPLYANLQKLASVVDYAINKGVLVKNFKEAYIIKKPIVSLGLWQDSYHRLLIGNDGIYYA